MSDLALKSRVDTLEEYMKELSYQSLRTERELERLSREMREFKDEMSDFKDEMTDFKDEMSGFKDEMTDFKDEMRGFKDEMTDFKDEMSDFKDEMRVFKTEINRKWGELANKMGTLVEDIFAPGLPEVAARYFDCPQPDDLMVRRRRVCPADPARQREFDLMAVCGRQVFLVEVKSTPRVSYVDELISFLRERTFFEYFPEYAEHTLVPVFASLYIPKELVTRLSRKGIYAMAMSGSAVDLLNFEDIPR
jgi:hypothetical protein